MVWVNTKPQYRVNDATAAKTSCGVEYSRPAPLTVNAATLDAGFNPGVAEDILWLPPSVNSVVLQTDGKILLSGVFSHVAGLPRNALAQLHVDGTLDPTLNPVVGGD